MQPTKMPQENIVIEGEWTMNEAPERLEFLVGALAGQVEASARHNVADIDLTGITGLDACGCQLLSLYLENLKKHGITPRPTPVPQELRETVSLLGFQSAFAAPGTADEE